MLKKIIEYKRLELEYKKRQVSVQDVRFKALDNEPARPFLKNFKKNDINIIAEVKKASPSAGVIRADFKPVEIAKIYEENGAKAISVLTDEKFFQGHLDYLTNIKKSVSLPILRKDFTIDEYHIYEGRAAGADAMLLNLNILDDYEISDFHALVLDLGMMPLLEVRDQKEWERARKLPLQLLGINNRYLDTFDVDIQTTLRLLKHVSKNIPVISESGLKDHETLVKLQAEGVAGFLIGESLVKEKDIGKKLRELAKG